MDKERKKQIEQIIKFNEQYKPKTFEENLKTILDDDKAEYITKVYDVYVYSLIKGGLEKYLK